MIKNEKDDMDKPAKYIPLKDVLQQGVLNTYKKKLQDIITCELDKCV
jgi:hypothetical protein